ncbi:MAG: glucokinase [Elusimicrobiota bacterium]|jgi:glucokinase
MILVSDLGGTHARLALFEGGLLRADKTYPTRSHSDFGAVVRLFLREHPASVESACFGVPGPVCGERVVLPNLPWVIERAELVEAAGTGRVRLANDLECAARGLPLLSLEKTAALRPASGPERGIRAVVAAGTGLGEAVLVPAGAGWRALASEGGHTDFGPLDELQAEFLRWMWREHPRPTYELVLSGPGLTRIARFLRERGGEAADPALDAHDAGSAVIELGMSGRSALCRHALELFAAVYVAEAANVAVQYLASGGVFLWGGIAPRILPLLRKVVDDGAFTAKVKMRGFLEGVPLRVVLDERLGLLGAAALASEQE